MTAYDDAELSCSMCSVGLGAEALCDCDIDPMCWRDHAVYHVEQGRWVTPPGREDIGDALMERALSTWGSKGWAS